jgi:hypothetical protein
MTFSIYYQHPQTLFEKFKGEKPATLSSGLGSGSGFYSSEKSLNGPYFQLRPIYSHSQRQSPKRVALPVPTLHPLLETQSYFVDFNFLAVKGLVLCLMMHTLLGD